MIKAEYDSNTLRVFLEENLTIENASTIKEDIYEILNNKIVEHFIFDCEKLNYISSAGLRVILEIGKKYNTSLENVSRNVYEILDISGFTGIFDVKKVLREISIDGCQLVGSGASSRVYRYNGDTMVKVFLPGVSLERIYAETKSARKSFMAGIPSAIPFDVCTCNGNYATMFEMIDGKPLSKVFMEEPDKFDDLSKKYVKLLLQFHSIEARKDDFPDIRDKYHIWIENLNKYLTPKEVKQVRKLFDAIPFRSTMLHVDPHCGNIMVTNGNLMFIDMADISIGHPLADLGTEYFHYMVLPETSLGAKLIMGDEPKDKNLMANIWNVIENEYFGDAKESDKADIHNMLKYFGCLRCLILVSKHAQLPLEAKKELIERQRIDLFPHIEEATKLFAKANKYFK